MVEIPDPKSSSRINFYRPDENYGFLSNFSKHSVNIDSVHWPTVEHYFQAQKFHGTTWEQKIRQADSPKEAKKLGSSRSLPLRKDWDDVRNEIMYNAVKAKFLQHPQIKKALLGTGNAYLAEHTKNDHYWGDGGDDTGKNQLGCTLMQVRADLQKEPSETTEASDKTEVPETKSATAETQSTQEPEKPKDSEKKPTITTTEEQDEEDEGEEEDDLEPNPNHLPEQEAEHASRAKTKSQKKKDAAQEEALHWKKQRARNLRSHWTDNDGNAFVEKSVDNKGQIALIGKTLDASTNFSEKALPSSARTVVYRQSFKNKYQPKVSKERNEDDEFDDDEPVEVLPTVSLGDFIAPKQTLKPKVLPKAQPPKKPQYESLQVALTEASDTLDLAEPLAGELAEMPDLKQKCKGLLDYLQEYLQDASAPISENETDLLFNYVERLNKILN